MTDDQIHKLIAAYKSRNYRHVRDIGPEEMCEVLEEVLRYRESVRELRDVLEGLVHA